MPEEKDESLAQQALLKEFQKVTDAMIVLGARNVATEWALPRMNELQGFADGILKAYETVAIVEAKARIAEANKLN